MPQANHPLEPLLSRARAYAGIGSRVTPAYALSLMEGVAAMLAARGLSLRSGGAPGADMAFEWGCHQIGGRNEIFLPWRRFNGHPSEHFMPPPQAQDLAALVHPNWRACSPFARRFHARNCQQLLGANLDDPVGFILFWAHERDGTVRGGTATAVHLARRLNIPTYNLRDPAVFDQWSLAAGEYLAFRHPVEGHPFSFLTRAQPPTSPPSQSTQELPKEPRPPC